MMAADPGIINQITTTMAGEIIMPPPITMMVANPEIINQIITTIVAGEITMLPPIAIMAANPGITNQIIIAAGEIVTLLLTIIMGETAIQMNNKIIAINQNKLSLRPMPIPAM